MVCFTPKHIHQEGGDAQGVCQSGWIMSTLGCMSTSAQGAGSCISTTTKLVGMSC